MLRDAEPVRTLFHRDMGAPDRVELSLAVDPSSDPITGTLGDRHGQRVDFSGWLGFAVALEELLGPKPGSAAASTAEVSLEPR